MKVSKEIRTEAYGYKHSKKMYKPRRRPTSAQTPRKSIVCIHLHPYIFATGQTPQKAPTKYLNKKITKISVVPCDVEVFFSTSKSC